MEWNINDWLCLDGKNDELLKGGKRKTWEKRERDEIWGAWEFGFLKPSHSRKQLHSDQVKWHDIRRVWNTLTHIDIYIYREREKLKRNEGKNCNERRWESSS